MGFRVNEVRWRGGVGDGVPRAAKSKMADSPAQGPLGMKSSSRCARVCVLTELACVLRD